MNGKRGPYHKYRTEVSVPYNPEELKLASTQRLTLKVVLLSNCLCDIYGSVQLSCFSVKSWFVRTISYLPRLTLPFDPTRTSSNHKLRAEFHVC